MYTAAWRSFRNTSTIDLSRKIRRFRSSPSPSSNGGEMSAMVKHFCFGFIVIGKPLPFLSQKTVMPYSVASVGLIVILISIVSPVICFSVWVVLLFMVIWPASTGSWRSFSSSRRGLILSTPSAGRLSSLGSDWIADWGLFSLHHAHITRRPSGVRSQHPPPPRDVERWSLSPDQAITVRSEVDAPTGIEDQGRGIGGPRSDRRSRSLKANVLICYEFG